MQTLTVLQVTFISVGYRFTRTLVFFNVIEVKCQIVLYLLFNDFNMFQCLVVISIAVLVDTVSLMKSQG